ncbi:hypothetical protein NPS01_34310 [Nocardioides psychrotolerans]|uniref:NADH-quinone oxidoreductase subunit H n=1 Tax=Nocardioides psychrotolerans TaxID=1005945 RepID=A0A1I3CDS4_9ACTN|nr:hypothetical protein [Nocardioides psychrotolerans]GEP39768.1 hypothetical protein NPS01_34310 [Nocardioides psychrotolerans]SFH72680.1 hypothetical protein SAMN05216561_10217 [Nocardioides psychrotolerans]
MTFDLLPSITPFAIAFLAVAGLAIVLALAVMTDVVVGNRRTRVARHQSIRTYYGRLALSH